MSDDKAKDVATQDLISELKDIQSQPDCPHPDFVTYVK